MAVFYAKFALARLLFVIFRDGLARPFAAYFTHLDRTTGLAPRMAAKAAFALRTAPGSAGCLLRATPPDERPPPVDVPAARQAGAPTAPGTRAACGFPRADAGRLGRASDGSRARAQGAAGRLRAARAQARTAGGEPARSCNPPVPRAVHGAISRSLTGRPTDSGEWTARPGGGPVGPAGGRSTGRRRLLQSPPPTSCR